MTKIAVPLFDERISPRFDCAQSFLLLVVENGKIVDRKELATENWTSVERTGRLSALGVDILICGGIDEVAARRLIHNGIRVYAWVTGMARDAVVSLLNGDLEPGIMVGADGHSQGRWRLKGKGPHFGEDRGKKGMGRGRRRGRRQGPSAL